MKYQKNETVFELDSWLGRKDKIKAISKEDFYVTINKKDIRHLTVSLEYNGPISAPIKKDTKIANIIVSKKGEEIKNLPLYAAEDLKKVNFFKSLLTSLNYLIWEMFKQNPFIVFRSEGCGKSFQSKKLFNYLKKGVKTILTREPGGTKFGINKKFNSQRLL